MASALGGTIVARASGTGHSARAIVRLSGPDALAAVASIAAADLPAAVASRAEAASPAAAARPADGNGVPRVRGVHKVRMRVHVCGSPCECPALALVMPGPASFTGEDCVELLLPGNPALADAVVESLMRAPGVAAAAPGAFMARAHAAGRIAVADAERIALEIGAMHAQDLDAARQVQSNPLVQAAHAASAEVADLLARVEAGIDFTDSEDVVAIARGDLCSRAHTLRDEIARWIQGSVPVESMGSVPVVALRGPPNAGKSSLFNALLGRTRAVASPVAGTTRDAIAEEIELRPAGADGAQPPVRAMLMDTPGIEDPRSAIDALMQEQARAADRADVIVLCEPLASVVAGGAQPEPTGGSGVAAVARTGDAGQPHAPTVIRVATRSDEMPHAAHHVPAGMLRTSVVTGEGVAALAAAIAAALRLHEGGTGGSHRIGVLARHREAMGKAATWLETCIGAAGVGPGPAVACPELVADALRGALDALGEVTGAITPDDVLGLVFSRFCIGK